MNSVYRWLILIHLHSHLFLKLQNPRRRVCRILNPYRNYYNQSSFIKDVQEADRNIGNLCHEGMHSAFDGFGRK